MKSAACAKLQRFQKGKELSQSVASGHRPPGDSTVGPVVSPGSKERWKFVLGSPTDGVASW